MYVDPKWKSQLVWTQMTIVGIVQSRTIWRSWKNFAAAQILSHWTLGGTNVSSVEFECHFRDLLTTFSHKMKVRFAELADEGNGSFSLSTFKFSGCNWFIIRIRTIPRSCSILQHCHPYCKCVEKFGDTSWKLGPVQQSCPLLYQCMSSIHLLNAYMVILMLIIQIN